MIVCSLIIKPVIARFIVKLKGLAVQTLVLGSAMLANVMIRTTTTFLILKINIKLYRQFNGTTRLRPTTAINNPIIIIY